MKREAPNLFAALLLGVFGNVLLTSQVGYLVRPLSLIHIWRCRRRKECRSRWSPYH